METVSDLTIASLEGFACFERDEDLEDRGGTTMSTGIPYGGAAQKWHDNPLQEEVDGLRQALSEMQDRHMSEKHRRMNYEETLSDIRVWAKPPHSANSLRQIEMLARNALENNRG
jgi:hypothetical protein